MGLFRFLFSKAFFINLILAGLVFVGFLYGVFKFLDDYTDHGVARAVPDFRGMEIADLNMAFESEELRYEIIDSVFLVDVQKGTVVEQEPRPGDSVKNNRKIFLTINGFSSKMITLPQTEAHINFLVSHLESLGFEIKDTNYVSGKNGHVKKVQFEGKDVIKGDKLPYGSELSLFVGKEGAGKPVSIPVMLSKKYEYAKKVTKWRKLNLIATFDEDCCPTAKDSANAIIYRQFPETSSKKKMHEGETMFINLTTDSLKIKNELGK